MGQETASQVQTTVSSIEVTNEGFADEIRAERLGIIWKTALIIATVLFWGGVTWYGLDSGGQSLFTLGAPWLALVAGSLACRFLLQRDNISSATWAFTLGILGGIAILLYNTDGTGREIVPFLTLVPVYIVGLMLPIRAIPNLLILNIALIIGVPILAEGSFIAPTTGGILAIVLGLIAALLSVQASGELYAIAEWALENYRRERDSAARIYESRQQVERSLNRQRALTKEIENTNAELDEARSAAEEAKHFRGQFLANMSHELRTPLNAVIGFSETMLNFPPMYNNVELPDEYRQDLLQIHNSGKHLLSIINDILDLSKIDAGRLDLNMQRVELEPIFKGVMSTAVGLIGGKPIKLTRDTPEPLPMPLGDAVRVRQVLLNIYSNAAKFTEKGSIKLSLRHDDEFITISVQDTGEGIHPDDMIKLFEEFRQGSAGRKKARAGSGLGLAISRQLLDLMGGKIWIESELDKGTTVSFTLPIYKPDAPAAAPQLEAEAAKV